MEELIRRLAEERMKKACEEAKRRIMEAEPKTDNEMVKNLYTLFKQQLLVEVDRICGGESK